MQPQQMQGQPMQGQPMGQPMPMQGQQQVVVTQAPVVQQTMVQTGPTNGGIFYKATPIPFWVLVVVAVIYFITGMASGDYAGGILVPLIFGVYAATIYSLIVRVDPQGLYVGFEPGFCPANFLQNQTIPYSNIESYYEAQNQCWYPIGWKPGYFDPLGSDCPINFFFPGCCCCTNTCFYNGACIFCCCVVSMPRLFVMKLRQPITCCCHTMPFVAVSVNVSEMLGQALAQKGIPNGRGGTTTTTVVTTGVVQQPVPMQTQQMPMQTNYQQPMQTQPMQGQPMVQQNMGMQQNMGQPMQQNYPNLQQQQPN